MLGYSFLLNICSWSRYKLLYAYHSWPGFEEIDSTGRNNDAGEELLLFLAREGKRNRIDGVSWFKSNLKMN
jgi:hypothetical protein